MSLTLDLRAKYNTPDTIEYHVTDSDFEAVENSLANGGDLMAKVVVSSCSVGLDVKIAISGIVRVECDRCLEDMNINVNVEENLKIQFTNDGEDSEDVICVADSQKELDLWPTIYDYIVLSIPLTHTHAEGECDKDMTDTLKKYLVTSTEEYNDDSDEFVDD